MRGAASENDSAEQHNFVGGVRRQVEFWGRLYKPELIAIVIAIIFDIVAIVIAV